MSIEVCRYLSAATRVVMNGLSIKIRCRSAGRCYCRWSDKASTATNLGKHKTARIDAMWHSTPEMSNPHGASRSIPRCKWDSVCNKIRAEPETNPFDPDNRRVLAGGCWIRQRSFNQFSATAWYQPETSLVCGDGDAPTSTASTPPRQNADGFFFKCSFTATINA